MLRDGCLELDGSRRTVRVPRRVLHRRRLKRGNNPIALRVPRRVLQGRRLERGDDVVALGIPRALLRGRRLERRQPLVSLGDRALQLLELGLRERQLPSGLHRLFGEGRLVRPQRLGGPGGLVALAERLRDLGVGFALTILRRVERLPSALEIGGGPRDEVLQPPALAGQLLDAALALGDATGRVVPCGGDRFELGVQALALDLDPIALGRDAVELRGPPLEVEREPRRAPVGLGGGRRRGLELLLERADRGGQLGRALLERVALALQPRQASRCLRGRGRRGLDPLTEPHDGRLGRRRARDGLVALDPRAKHPLRQRA